MVKLMRHIATSDARNKFSELIDIAQREPVTIERNGRPVVVMLAIEDYEAAERAKVEALKAMVAEGDKAYEEGQYSAFDDTIVEEICAEGLKEMEQK